MYFNWAWNLDELFFRFATYMQACKSGDMLLRKCTVNCVNFLLLMRLLIFHLVVWQDIGMLISNYYRIRLARLTSHRSHWSFARVA